MPPRPGEEDGAGVALGSHLGEEPGELVVELGVNDVEVMAGVVDRDLQNVANALSPDRGAAHAQSMNVSVGTPRSTRPASS
jgi:hypothetical protein